MATTAASLAEPRDGLSPALRNWAVFAISLAVIMAVMDGAMINVALPAIAHDLGATPAASIWVVNAYQLAGAMALLPVGKLADTFGHKRVYLICLTMFMAGSLGCAMAPSLPWLAAARFFQGLGMAGLMGCTNAMLRFVYPRALLGRGIGLNAMIVALALVSGPTIASGVLAVASWPWLFTVNLPLGGLLLLIGARTLPSTETTSRGFDGPSAALSALSLGAMVLSIDDLAHGLSPAAAAALLALGLAAGALLLRRQAALPAPLLPVDLLRRRPFALAVVAVFLASCAQAMAYVALPFLFRYGLGRGQFETGLLFAPWPLAVALAAPAAGILSNRFAPGLLCCIGMGVFALGLGLLAMLGPGAATAEVVWRVALCGLGYGFFQAPNSRALITSIPLARSASAGSMGATGRVVGQALGSAAVALLFRISPAHGDVLALSVAAAVALGAALVNVLRGFRAGAPALV